MSMQYPSSSKVHLIGIAHRGRIIDNILLRHARQIQDYIYLTVGFDRYLLDFLELDASAFEQREHDEGTDMDLADWICTYMRAGLGKRPPGEPAHRAKRTDGSGG